MPKIEVPPDSPVATMEPPKVEQKRPPGSKPERKKSLLEDALCRNNPKPANADDPIEHLPPITFELDGDLVMEATGYGREDQIRIANDKYEGRARSKVDPDDTPSWPLSSLIYEQLANAMEPELAKRADAFNALVDRASLLQADRNNHLVLGKVKISIEFAALKE